MEEKKISEQESLELINQMIEQTRRDSTVGSGNTFLIWGYVCMVVSLAVFVAAYTGPGAWGWLYLGIPVMGGVATLIAGRKKKNAPSTYTSKSINSIWACLAGVFAAYAVYCLGYWAEMEGWSGMFLLGLLLPGIGTYCTGTILKEELLKATASGAFVILNQKNSVNDAGTESSITQSVETCHHVGVAEC